MMTETNQKRTAVEFDLNTLEPVMDDNSINNTVTPADRMKQYIDIEVKGTGRRPTYKQLEAASKQRKSEPFPRIKMLDYQNEEIQAQSAFINNENTLHNVSAADTMNRLIKKDPEITYRQLKKVSDDYVSKGGEAFPENEMAAILAEQINSTGGQRKASPPTNDNNSPKSRQKTPEAEMVSRAENRRRMGRLCLTVSLRRAIGTRAMSRSTSCSTRTPGSAPTARRWRPRTPS